MPILGTVRSSESDRIAATPFKKDNVNVCDTVTRTES